MLLPAYLCAVQTHYPVRTCRSYLPNMVQISTSDIYRDSLLDSLAHQSPTGSLVNLSSMLENSDVNPILGPKGCSALCFISP